MKIITQLLFVISIFTLLHSCSKEENIDESSEFIEAKIGNQLERYEYTDGNEFNNAYYNDTIVNNNGTFIQDQLNLIRYAEDQSKSFDIFILGRQLKKEDVPTTLNNVELQWRDYDNEVPVVFATDDDYNFVGNVELTIEDWDENNFLKGNFAGTIATKTGKELSVEDGKFRIQIID